MAVLDARTFLVTGATSGIGRETVRALATAQARVFLACRSRDRALLVIDEIARETGNAGLAFLPLDLGDLSSVRACAEAFLATGEPLHVLINNAGATAGLRYVPRSSSSSRPGLGPARERSLTASGFELTFGINYVGPYALTSLLLDRLRESSPARVVNVSSSMHYAAPGIDFDRVREPTRSFAGWPEYAVSKLANVLHAQELARRLEGSGVTTYALHPGVVATDIWRAVPRPLRPLVKLAMRSPAQGAVTTLHCATAPELGRESGQYYDNARRKPPSPVATAELAGELWERTAGWVSETSAAGGPGAPAGSMAAGRRR